MTRSEFSPRRSSNDRSDVVNSNVPSTDEAYLSKACSIPPMNIDKPKENVGHDNDQRQTRVSLVVMSSWKKTVAKNKHGRDDDDDDEDDDHLAPMNTIHVIFTLSDAVSNGSILNQSVFITDAIHNQLLASFHDICINASSFIINYSTRRPLPHNVCLYLLLNTTSSVALREIFTCRTINKDPPPNNDGTHESHTVGPSLVFIISQGVVIFLMTVFVYLVHTAREKRIVNRVGQRLLRTIPIARIIRHDTTNNTNDIHMDNFILSSVEAQASAAGGLPPVHNDRNHTLINITELTKRLSA